MRRLVVALVVALLLSPVLASAQATMTATTLSAALANDSSVDTFAIASATGVAVDSLGVVDREVVRVKSVTGTTIVVTRGYGSSNVAAHGSGAKIWFGVPERFAQTDPLPGTCTATAELALPRVNANNGRVWNCLNSIWTEVTTGRLHVNDYGTVTQITSITTGVTLSAIAGTITTVSNTIAAAAEADFIVTNTNVALTDVVVVSIATSVGAGTFAATVAITTAGTFTIRLTNLGAATGDNVIVLNFRVLKQGA